MIYKNNTKFYIKTLIEIFPEKLLNNIMFITKTIIIINNKELFNYLPIKHETNKYYIKKKVLYKLIDLHLQNKGKFNMLEFYKKCFIDNSFD